MADEKKHPHIFLENAAWIEQYSYPGGGGSEQPLPDVDRASHAKHLLSNLQEVRREAKERRNVPQAWALPTKKGVHVEFESEPGFDLELESLEDRQQGIQLVAVRESPLDHEVTLATVYVPEGKLANFEKKIKKYGAEDTKTGKPWHQKLVEKISHIRLAHLRSFWTDDKDLLPASDEAIWWEVWLRASEEEVWSEFRETVEKIGVRVSGRTLEFPSTRVLLAYGTLEQFAVSVEAVDAIAELRRAKEIPTVFMEMPIPDQREWIEDLVDRISIPSTQTPSICVLDTGVNAGHPMLEIVADSEDIQAVDPGWGVEDHDPRGHGTGVAGLSLYGNLVEPLLASHQIEPAAWLESVKILPPPPQFNDPELYGRVTEQAVSRVEITHPRRRRSFVMTIATADGREQGKPSSWSAAVDKLAYGEEGDTQRLFILSAGNSDREAWHDHPDHLLTEEIHDPGQAWNAITVGASTELWRIQEADFEGWEAVARPGDLSPSTSTSTLWDTPWPLKPDVVMEGGNAARSPNREELDTLDSLSLLTTHHRFRERLWATFGDTSAAGALVVRMAALLQRRYPDYWPETIRALIVHSANWTRAMLERYEPQTKTDYADLIRECGFGIPSLERAQWSADNRLTLIAQEAFQPFAREPGKYYAALKELRIYDLPWPIEQLRELGETEVELRVTLSYFIEPNPSERGYEHRHRYQSHGLRFDVRGATESLSDFRKRLNKAAREEGEKSPGTSDTSGWLVGSDARHRGSVHSDIWRGTAVELANRQHVAVYPVTGWWKERHHLERWRRNTRYSLIVSIHAPEIEVDLYTPVLAEIGVPVEISVDTGGTTTE